MVSASTYQSSERRWKKRAAIAAHDKIASEIVAINVRDVVTFADLFLIASGRSDRHVRSIAEGNGRP